MGKEIDYGKYKNPGDGFAKVQNPAENYKALRKSIPAGIEKGLQKLHSISNLFFHSYFKEIDARRSSQEFYDDYIIGKNILEGDDHSNRWDILGVNTTLRNDNSSISKVKQELRASLRMPNSIVIYLGHAAPLVDKKGKLVKTYLNPLDIHVDMKKKINPNQFITDDELTSWVNAKDYKATLLIVSACSSIKLIQNVNDPKKLIVLTDSGKNLVSHSYGWGNATEIIFDSITGWHLVDDVTKGCPLLPSPAKFPSTDLNSALYLSNKAFPIASKDDIQILKYGDGNCKFFR